MNVAMPHLRGKWSPTKAILRILELLFMRSPLLFGGPYHFDQSDSPGCATDGKWSGSLKFWSSR